MRGAQTLLFQCRCTSIISSRIDDFPGLTSIRHIFEIAEKSRRLGQSLEVPPARVHRNPTKIESEDSDKFSSDAYCHLLLHPIALTFRSRLLDFTGKYLLHCHMMNHEELGMMQVVGVYAD